MAIKRRAILDYQAENLASMVLDENNFLWIHPPQAWSCEPAAM